MNKIDKQVNDLLDKYHNMRGLEKDDWDDGYDDWEENWNVWCSNLKEIIRAFLTKPSKAAYKVAHKYGWENKRIRDIEYVVIGD